MSKCCGLVMKKIGNKKIDDLYLCQHHPGLQGKGGEQQFHLSCVNAVDSICRRVHDAVQSILLSTSEVDANE